MTIRFRCKCGRKFEVADTAAGRKARCTDCGLTFLVPSPHAAAAQPAGGQAARPHAPRPSPRPAAPTTVHRPAAPASRPAAPNSTYAPQEDDDVPMARLAPVPVHQSSRKPTLTAVQAVAGVSTVVALVVIVDSVATMLGAIQAQIQGMNLVYGAAAIFAGLGVIVALAGGAGSRVCIGIMLGGAARNVLVNGPILLFLAFSKSEIVTSQGKDAVMVWGLAGVFSLLASIVYIMAILLSKSVRKYIGGHLGLVFGMGVVGLLLGPLVVSTALPSPELVYARYFTVQRVTKSTAEGVGGVAKVLTPKQQTENRDAMMDRMKDIYAALDRYVYKQDRRRLPAYLGQLVGDDCPSDRFISPTRGPGAKGLRDPGGDVRDSDVIYLFKEGRDTTQFESAPNKAELIVAYSGPRCGLGDGALVMRLPGIPAAAPVEWLDKVKFDKQMAATDKWLKDNPAPEKSIMPDKLPGFDE